MPDVSARAVCEGAIELIGVASAEQPIPAVMAERALQTLNTMLDAWAIERVLTYTRPKLALPLVPGRGTYTWGEVSPALPTPDVVGPPPVRLELCLLQVPHNGSGGLAQEWPIQVLTQDQYEAGIWMKQLQSSYPQYVYLEQSQPVAHLHIWPVPELPYTLQLSPWQASAPYAHFNHVLPWPNGYQLAFEYNLAVLLAPRYGVQVSSDIRQVAEESKRLLGNVNATVGRLTSDVGGCLQQSDIPVVDLAAFLRF
jgi:hypothetical protein